MAALGYFVNPSGEVVEAPADESQARIDAGYQIATPEQAAAFLAADERAKTYSTTGQTALAGTEAALRALTFGGSTILSRAMGVPAEDIAAREAANPVAAGLGTAAGILVPTVLSGGAAGVAEGAAAGAGEAAAATGARTLARTAAEYSAPALVSRLGQGATRAAEAVLPQAESFVGQIARKAAAQGLGSAVEGAAYGAGQVVHEAALGDPNLTAQSALATVGLSAALGGGIGAGLGVVGGVGSAALAKAREATGGVLKAFVEKYPAYASRLTGATEDDIRTLMTNRARIEAGASIEDVLRETRGKIAEPAPFTPRDLPPEAVYTPREVPDEAIFRPGEAPEKPIAKSLVPPEEVEKSARVMTDALQEQADHTSEATRDAFTKYRPSETRLHIGATSTDDALAEVSRAVKQIDRAAKEMRAKPEMFPGIYPSTLDGIREGLEREAGSGDAAKMFDALNAAKREMDPLAKWNGPVNPEHQPGVRALKGLRDDLKTSLENPDVWGEAGARQSAFNAATHEFIDAEKAFNASFGRRTGFVGGRPKYAIDPGRVERFLSDLGDQKNSIKEEIFARYQAATRAMHDEIEKSAALEFSGDYSREAAGDLASRIESARGAAHARNAAEVLYESTTAEQKAQMQAWRGQMEAFRGTERERKALADKMWEEFRTSEATRKAEAKAAETEFKAAEKARQSEAKAAGVEYKAAVKAQDADVKQAARDAKGGARWNGFMDIIGAGASGANPLLAPFFVAYRAMKYLGSPEKTVRVLAALERTNATIGRKIEAAASTLVRAGARAASVGRAEVSAGIGKVFGKPPEAAAATFAKRLDHINDLANNPAALQAALERQTDGVHEHAPDTAVALNTATSRAVAFLASKAPQQVKNGIMPPLPPSAADVARFHRYYEAVERPHDILKQAAAGTLTPEAVEAVRTVYPEMFEKQIVPAIMSKLAEVKSVPYRSRLMIGMLLGQDVDGSMTAASVAANQATLSGPSVAPSQRKPGKPHPTTAGAGKVSLSSRFLTPGQRALARGD
jgi:hypothetical protein